MNWKHICGHILFWVIIMLTYALSEWGYRDNFWAAILFELIFLPVRLVAVYTNWFLLIPGWLYKNRILKYLLSLSILLFTLAIIQRYFVLYWAYPVFFPEWLSNSKVIEPLIFFRIVQNVVIIVSPVAFSTGIKIFIDWYAERNRAKQLAIEKKEAELKYLKSQINPHFLFNTLNNLYGLSIEQSKKVPGLILKLSDFLDFALYESANEKIEVGKEIKLVKDFIDLETERYPNRVAVNWEIEHSILDKKMAPLLFIPLVENAFKHGVREELREAKIDLTLRREKDHLVFTVKNSLPRDDWNDGSSGIGLKNLRRRLELLYPNTHNLYYEEGEVFFTAVLELSI